MKELSFLKVGVGMNQHAFDRAVFAAQPGRIVEDFSAQQFRQHLLDYVAVRMELGDRVADIVLRSVSKQFQFGFVGPQDSSVRANFMNAFNGIIKEIGKFALALEINAFSISLR